MLPISQRRTRRRGTTSTLQCSCSVAVVGILYLAIDSALLYAFPVQQLLRLSYRLRSPCPLAFGSCRNRGISLAPREHPDRARGLNADLIVGAGIPYGLARDGLFPKFARPVDGGAIASGLLRGRPVARLTFRWLLRDDLPTDGRVGSRATHPNRCLVVQAPPLEGQAFLVHIARASIRGFRPSR